MKNNNQKVVTVILILFINTLVLLLLAKLISVPCKVVLDMSYDYNSQKIYILSLNVIIIVVNLFFSYAYDYLKKKSNEILFYKKIRNVIFITLLCSSYFYITYLTAIIGDNPLNILYYVIN
jgi:hypothetical protein